MDADYYYYQDAIKRALVVFKHGSVVFFNVEEVRRCHIVPTAQT